MDSIPLQGTERNMKELREPVRHGTALFPAALYEITSPVFTEERIWCHWHEEMEFLVVTRGNATLRIFDRSYPLKEKDIAIIPPGSLHSAVQKTGQPFSFFALVFSLSFLDSLADDAIHQKYLSPFFENRLAFPEYFAPGQAWQQQILMLLFSLRDLLRERKNGFELLVKARLYEIWHLLNAHCKTSAPLTEHTTVAKTSLIKPILSFLQENYDRPLSLKELSETFHMSEGHFCRFFRAMTGTSVTEYLNHYRISVSTQLLFRNDCSIGEIAGMTGFNNISYFNKIFRRYMHMTPSQFRRRKQDAIIKD